MIAIAKLYTIRKGAIEHVRTDDSAKSSDSRPQQTQQMLADWSMHTRSLQMSCSEYGKICERWKDEVELKQGDLFMNKIL